jgi:hypothetical protein
VLAVIGAGMLAFEALVLVEDRGIWNSRAFLAY